MVFSLSKEKELVKLQERRGKARGRGRITSNKSTPQVGGAKERSAATTTTQTKYPPPKSGSGGITVIEPLDKGEEKQEPAQFNDSTADTSTLDSTDDRPGLPSRGHGGNNPEKPSDTPSIETESAKSKVETPPVSSASSQQASVEVAGKEGPGVPSASVPKPKRYSSQRQKVASSGQSDEQG